MVEQADKQSMTKQKILDAYYAQKETMQTSPLRTVDYRIKKLKQLYKNILELQEEIYTALKIDLNKSKTESYMTEIGLVLSEISYMIKHVKKFSKAKRVKTPLAHFVSKSFVKPCPKGQVLIISPWNYPFMLAIEPLVDAISAGNVVILKPSETSNNVTKVIDKLIKKTFNEKEVFTVIGGREECSFLLDLDFDHIFFTGSTRVGKIVLEKSAQHFTSVTLEMGGKSPCIVDETANIELAAKHIVFGKFLNAGQTCVAPDYIYCHKNIKDKLVQAIKKQILLQYSSNPINNDAYPKLINKKQFDASLKLISKENLLYGGKSSEEKLKIEPTLIKSSFQSDDMQTEIFGPVLPVLTFENIDEAIENINKLSHSLALYIFSSNKHIIDKVLSKCSFGGGCINDCVIHIATPYMAFGGLKQSGIGGYHGKVGFDTFSHKKSVVDKKTWFDLPLRYQPYSKFKLKMIKKFIK